MTDGQGQDLQAVRDEVEKLWQSVLEHVAKTGAASSEELPFLLPNTKIAQMEPEESWQAYVRKRLFLEYAVAAGKRAGHPLDALIRELDHMVRALMPLTQRWQEASEAGETPVLPHLDDTLPLEEQLAAVRYNGAVLFPGEEQPELGRHLLLAPFHTQLADEVRRAAATPFESWINVERADAECRDGLMPVFGTEQARIAVVPGAASLGVEVAIVTASAPGGFVLVLGHGPGGQRVVDITSRRGRVADLLSADASGRIDTGILQKRLLETHPSAVVITHVDAENGAVAPIDTYAPVISSLVPDAMLVIDGTMATGCLPQRADEWHADLVFTDSASSLGGCAGMVLAALSGRLYERRVRNYAVPLYIELSRWSTPTDAEVPPALVFALRAALRGLAGEGLPAHYARCEQIAAAFREEASAHGFTVAVPAGCESAGMTVMTPPDGVTAEDVRDRLLHKGIEVGLTTAGIAVAHNGSVGTTDLSRFWRTVEALHLS